MHTSTCNLISSIHSKLLPMKMWLPWWRIHYMIYQKRIQNLCYFLLHMNQKWPGQSSKKS